MLSDPDELLVYESDGLTLFRALADFVVFPTTADQVSAVVRLANRERLPFVARGAGTGLSGGAAAEGGMVVSLKRMNRMLGWTTKRLAWVQPGLVNLDLSRRSRRTGSTTRPTRRQQACTIGGNVANNSGGPHCLKYGVTSNHVLGVEAVLHDGERMSLGGRTRGPGLRPGRLIVGSEGTFGIATEIACACCASPRR